MANQYSELDTREYNGWANRSTWNIHLWLGNVESYYNEYSELVSMAAHHGNNDASWEWVKALYRRVWLKQAKADRCIWSHVDWTELRRYFDDAVKYAKEYPNS